MDHNDFYTFREYMSRLDHPLTASMEDYLEMIFRLSAKTGYVRIHELSQALNVQPPAATRMVQKLAESGLIDYEKYGVIVLEPLGKEMGESLLKRHNIVENFLKLLGVTENELLQETEKIEHTITDNTLKRFASFIVFLELNPSIAKLYSEYLDTY